MPADTSVSPGVWPGGHTSSKPEVFSTSRFGMLTLCHVAWDAMHPFIPFYVKKCSEYNAKLQSVPWHCCYAGSCRMSAVGNRMQRSHHAEAYSPTERGNNASAADPPMIASSTASAASSCLVAAPSGPSLFAFPLESNFNGQRYSQVMVQHVQEHGVQLQSTFEQSPEHAKHDQPAQHDQHDQRAQRRQHCQYAQHDQHAQCDQHTQHAQHGSQQTAMLDSVMQNGQHQTRHYMHASNFPQSSVVEQCAGSLLTGPRHDNSCQPADAQDTDRQGTEQHQLPGYTNQPLGGQGLLSSETAAQQTGQGRWHVLIDAAKACATAPPDLTKHPADFVVCFHASAQSF